MHVVVYDLLPKPKEAVNIPSPAHVMNEEIVLSFNRVISQKSSNCQSVFNDCMLYTVQFFLNLYC